jgi:Skp family chaperone for outer membrane proteins
MSENTPVVDVATTAKTLPKPIKIIFQVFSYFFAITFFLIFVAGLSNGIDFQIIIASLLTAVVFFLTLPVTNAKIKKNYTFINWWSTPIIAFVLLILSVLVSQSSPITQEFNKKSEQAQYEKKQIEENLAKDKKTDEAIQLKKIQDAQFAQTEEGKAQAKKLEEEKKAKEEKEIAERQAIVEKAKVDQEAKINNAPSLPEYKVLKRDANELKGNYYKVYGKVVQIQVGSGISAIRLSVNPGKYLDNDLIYIVGQGKVDVFEGDFATFILKSNGEYTYESQAGYKITLPLFGIEKLVK